MVGVEVPPETPLSEEVEASVKVHRAAFLAASAEGSFFRRKGKAAVLAGAVAKTWQVGKSGGG